MQQSQFKIIGKMRNMAEKKIKISTNKYLSHIIWKPKKYIPFSKCGHFFHLFQFPSNLVSFSTLWNIVIYSQTNPRFLHQICWTRVELKAINTWAKTYSKFCKFENEISNFQQQQILTSEEEKTHKIWTIWQQHMYEIRRIIWTWFIWFAD